MDNPAEPHADARADLIPLSDRGEVLETPQSVLRAHPLTPQEQMFVRNNNPYPAGADTLEGAALAGALEVGGLVERPFTLDLAQVRELPYVEVEAVMQCAGNGRAFYRDAEQIEGSQWARGGVLNGVFGGVRVRDLLERARARPEALYLTATGADAPETGADGPYEKSVPLADALTHGLIAYTSNGEPLAGVHGGPIRLLMPGYFGTVNVKWLRRLSLTEQETRHEAQRERYRVPTPEGSRPCWRQPLKSVVWHPQPCETLGTFATASGTAWNDGAVDIARVEVSLDTGQTWRAADLEAARGPYGWRRWSLALQLPPGEHELWCRATDADGRSQPLDGNATWNPEGYEWHGVDKVKFEVA